ncbi:hypothetical protein TB1_019099 [Malus domestica]
MYYTQHRCISERNLLLRWPTQDHRDRGIPIYGFISNGSPNIFIEELWAICKALDVALRLGIPRTWVESD